MTFGEFPLRTPLRTIKSVNFDRLQYNLLSEMTEDEFNALKNETINLNKKIINSMEEYLISHGPMIDRQTYDILFKELLDEHSKLWYQLYRRSDHGSTIRKKQNKRYQTKHCGELKQKRKKHYEKHKEEIRVKERKYRKEHKEEIKERRQEHYKENKEKITEQSRRYYQEHREEICRKLREKRAKKKAEKEARKGEVM